MAFIDDEIERLEAELAQLEPAVSKAGEIRAVLSGLIHQRDKAASRGSVPPAKQRRFVAMKARQEQIRAIERERPHATNQEIADELGITAARVSQVRSAMRDDGS